MSNYKSERLITSKIVELCGQSVKFIEREFRNLSPAGKYQTCLLTGAIVIRLLQNKDIFNSSNGPNVNSIVSLLEDDFQIFFKNYKNEYLNNGQIIENYGNEHIDKLNKIGNDVLIRKNKVFIKNSVEIGIGHMWDELDRYQKSFSRYNSGTGKVVMPEVIFISLYIYPFFLSLVPNSERPKYCHLISNELKSIYTISDLDFILIPAKLSDHLLTLINNDVNFVISLIKSNKQVRDSNSTMSTNKGCYVATLVYEDIDHPKVVYLRKYRDTRLSKNLCGKKLIHLYYKYSPKIVEILKPHKRLNKLIKNSLNLFIKILKVTE